MAKLTPAQMKKAVEEFKKKFTGGFLHASPSPSIKKFDPSKGDRAFPTEGVTFVTRDKDFADSFLGMHRNQKGGWDYDKGSTVYPLNVNLGKHFVPGSPEGKAAIKEFVKTLPADPDDAMSAAKRAELLQSGSWDVMEDPRFLDYLRGTGHDTFTVMEGGVPNVGIFDPKNIRGKFAKFNPEDAESPDFMKAAGGAVKAAKKALEHARQVPFVHYSNAPNISTLDPNRYGTGIKGAEASRLKSAPDIRPRTYIYTKAGGRKPEQGLGPHKYEGVAEDVYPLHDDPMGFSAIAKQKAIDPYMMQFGREVVDEATHLNELERLIKQAGYKGYANDDVGLLFDPTPVTKAVEKMASGGLVFDSESSDYDYKTAKAHGMGPTGLGEDEGHWGSVAPTSDDERQLHGMPEDSYVVLKGKSHPTFDKAETAEEERDSKIVKRGDRYYSIPKKK